MQHTALFRGWVAQAGQGTICIKFHQAAWEKFSGYRVSAGTTAKSPVFSVSGVSLYYLCCQKVSIRQHLPSPRASHRRWREVQKRASWQSAIHNLFFLHDQKNFIDQE